MLEKPRLLLYPWMVVDEDFLRQGGGAGKLSSAGDKMRRLGDPDSGGFLGFARWHQNPWPRWLRRFTGETIDVCETVDASLLFGLRRPWGLWRAWEVLDAEERRVGSLFGGVLLDAFGRRLASTLTALPGGSGKMIDPQNTEIARWFYHANGNLELVFGQEANPFVRMLLLGAILL